MHPMFAPPGRSPEVALPLRRDDETMQVLHCYCLQHNLSRRPSKGGVLALPGRTTSASLYRDTAVRGMSLIRAVQTRLS